MGAAWARKGMEVIVGKATVESIVEQIRERNSFRLEDLAAEGVSRTKLARLVWLATQELRADGRGEWRKDGTGQFVLETDPAKCYRRGKAFRRTSVRKNARSAAVIEKAAERADPALKSRMDRYVENMSRANARAADRPPAWEIAKKRIGADRIRVSVVDEDGTEEVLAEGPTAKRRAIET